MSNVLIFQDRAQAGSLLAGSLCAYDHSRDTVVLGLPRGGVPVAFEVACRLHLPLDLLIVRKLGVPGHAELAFGAIASGGVRVIHQPVVTRLHLTQETIETVAARELQELQRRESCYRHCTPHHEISGKNVILVDDGIATGSTMLAAVYAVRHKGAKRIIVAAPTASPEACETLIPLTDEIVIPSQPSHFHAVGQWYLDFPQVSDEEVCSLMETSTPKQNRQPTPHVRTV